MCVMPMAASGLRPSRSPLTDAVLYTWKRAGSAPRTPRWEGEPPPRPPASDVNSECMHWRMPPLYQNRPAPLADLIYPVSMRAKRLAYPCIKSGFPGATPRAGGAGGAAAPCRPPRRRTAPIRRQELVGTAAGILPAAQANCAHPKTGTGRHGCGHPARPPRRRTSLPNRHRQENYAV